MIEMNKTSYTRGHLTALLSTKLAALLATLLLFWPATKNVFADTTSPHTVLIVGDSISSAYGLATEEGWVALLQERLTQNELPLQVVNASVTGDTSSNGLARLPDLLTEYQPSLVIIELGGNDGLRGLSIKKLKKNLSSMASQSKDIGADVIIVAVQLPGNYGKAYNRLFQNAFSQVAGDTDSELVASLFEGMDASSEWFQSDGIHPSGKAQSVMLDNVWTQVMVVLEKIESEG